MSKNLELNPRLSIRKNGSSKASEAQKVTSAPKLSNKKAEYQVGAAAAQELDNSFLAAFPRSRASEIIKRTTKDEILILSDEGHRFKTKQVSTPRCVPTSSPVSCSMQTMQHELTLLYGSAIPPPTSVIPLGKGRQGSNENHLSVPQKISVSPPVLPNVLPETPLQPQSALSPHASLPPV